MDEYYSISVNSDPKSGLDLMASDMEPFQFPAFCEELDHKELLALDDPQYFYLAYSDSEALGICDEAISRASTAVTPQSDCSTRTTLSTSNVSPKSDILSFQDKPNSQNIEAMYHDTTQSIIIGRQSRAASATWPSTNNASVSLNGSLTPSRAMPHRHQSFPYQTPQSSLQDNRGTPPPPSSFFPSPNLQPQTSTSQSPYLSSNLNSSQIPQLNLMPTQNNYLQAAMAANASSYFTQPQSQPPPPQQLQQRYQQPHSAAFQQQQLLQQHLQAHQQRQALSNQANLSTFFPNQLHPHGGLPTSSGNTTPNLSAALSTSISTPNSNNNNPADLPNTTGNSSAGYQCFSHGCGGRHFSNWGNLVRHHRERQLRSKAGAKPTCPRCGKGFTRSSARDAHVAGLKCVLGRRRRGNGTNSSSAANATVSAATSGQSSGDANGSGSGNDESYDQDDGEADNDNESGSLGSGGEDLDEQDEREHEREQDHNNMDILGGGGGDKGPVASTSVTNSLSRTHDMDALGLALDFGLGAAHPGHHAYLAPQQLQFQ